MFPPDTKISGEYSHIFSNLAVPIRSCREFLERCHSKTDGLYTIYLQKPNSAETGNVFCDMTHDNGGWTLMISSATNQGWNKDNVQSRYVWNLALVCPNRLPLVYIHFSSHRFWLFLHHHLSLLFSLRMEPLHCLFQVTPFMYFAATSVFLSSRQTLNQNCSSLLVDRSSPCHGTHVSDFLVFWSYYCDCYFLAMARKKI